LSLLFLMGRFLKMLDNLYVTNMLFTFGYVKGKG